jgi:hypothetical protein
MRDPDVSEVEFRVMIMLLRTLDLGLAIVYEERRKINQSQHANKTDGKMLLAPYRPLMRVLG